MQSVKYKIKITVFGTDNRYRVLAQDTEIAPAPRIALKL